ncbi:MAG: AAA family ATPase [Lachnospiraceae bacterium]|nr:AAA family ATPase [Lachnospiraceae bacterium]
MNISRAKDTVKKTVSLYLKKDEWGTYEIPVHKQRPIFLIGAPGIGKTAIMEQVAAELGLALVSYSMTHHSRQSALGLPFIVKKEYGGREYSVSEYTMSEIIGSIHDTMEQSGISEGILFLDEINCVSETLYPSMLQFLQYKVFGRHKVPEGWVIVTAGNPPEYNRMVREFDVVTMDRLKVIEVEPDLKAWLRYAGEAGVHPAISAYLEVRPEHFFIYEQTAAGKSYVTARGWEDLSYVLRMYEKEGLEADEALMGQYLRSEKAAKEFAAYYELFNKYKRDYRIADILEGKWAEDTVSRAAGARFDERISLISMLGDRLEKDMDEVLSAMDILKRAKPLVAAEGTPEILERGIEALNEQSKRREAAGNADERERRLYRRQKAFMEKLKAASVADGPEGAKALYREELGKLKTGSTVTGERLSSYIHFGESAFGEGNELTIMLTRLTVSETASRFLASFSNEDYNRTSSKLLTERKREALREEIGSLEM